MTKNKEPFRNPLLIKPIFGNNVSIKFDIRANDKTKQTEVFARLRFTDNTNVILSEVVISMSTLRILANILPKTIEGVDKKIEEIIKTGIPKEKPKSSEPEFNYIS